jgi:hypothetical protein
MMMMLTMAVYRVLAAACGWCAADDVRSRLSMSQYALPVVLRVEPSLILDMLRDVASAGIPAKSNTSSPSSAPVLPNLASLVSILLVSRQLQLVADLTALDSCNPPLGFTVRQVRVGAGVPNTGYVSTSGDENALAKTRAVLPVSYLMGIHF